MLKAIGIDTKHTYAEGETKADVMRRLQVLYPYKKYSDSKRLSGSEVLPEAMRIF